MHELDVVTTFTDASDLWTPFLAGVGPAGAWVTAQDADTRAAVRRKLLRSVFDGRPGPVTLLFRAFVVATDREKTSG